LSNIEDSYGWPELHWPPAARPVFDGRLQPLDELRRFTEMRSRSAVLYILLGIALGLCLHMAIHKRDAEAGRAGPAFPITTADTAYA
jgi:hypothetical protein